MDTIFAESTAPGRAGVAIVRVSGPAADRVASVFGFALPAYRRASVRLLRNRVGEPLDEALVLRFPPGGSFTGEAAVELQVHGSPAVVRAIHAVLIEEDGFRIAEPGEFSRRALENGRLSLDQIEGLSDLLSAETEFQRRQAMAVFGGALARSVAHWRARLVGVLALVESQIDFADEEIPSDAVHGLTAELNSLAAEWRAECERGVMGERIRQGFTVALVGAPNTGKSTLLNCIAGRDVALTSEIAGTTRDVIEVRCDLRGMPVTFLDLAGLREARDPVERLGVERARDRAASADVRLFFGSGPFDVERQGGDILLSPMADLGVVGEGMAVSGLTGLGVSGLLEEIRARLSGCIARDAVAVRERHRVALQEAVVAVTAAEVLLSESDPAWELVGEELRRGTHALDGLVGKIGVEEVLGEIFATFCIGK